MAGGDGRMRDRMHPGSELRAMRFVAKHAREDDYKEEHHRWRRIKDSNPEFFSAKLLDKEEALTKLVEGKKDRDLTEERLAMQKASLDLRERAAAGKSESQKPQLESIPVEGPDEGWERVVALYERLLGGEG